MLSSISSNLQTVQKQVQQAATRAGREPSAVTLIAVSKTQPTDAVRAAYLAGQRHFAENYLQDAQTKVSALADLDLTWHFIGRVQSNKARSIAQMFDWVHTLDRSKIAERLSSARLAEPNRTPLNVCVQVNIDNDPKKAGLAPNDVRDFVQALKPLTGLRCRGLMTMLAQQTDVGASYARTAALYQSLCEELSWDTLSMGMSADFATAIAEGSTMIRVGTAIFGPRPE